MMEDVKTVSASQGHCLIVKKDGSLWAYGRNDYGQLCNGNTTDSSTPIKVMDSGVASACAGGSSSYIVMTDGSLYVCGLNNNGQLGDGTKVNIKEPKKVADNVVLVSSSAFAAYPYTALILKKDKSLWGCGNNPSGQLGIGTTQDSRFFEKIMDNVAYMSAGYGHAVILKDDSSVWTCGYNAYYQLGNGKTTNSSTPILVANDVAKYGLDGETPTDFSDAEDTDISTLDNTLYINNVESFAGKELTLSVRMKNTVQAEGFNFDLYLPEGVSILQDEEGYPEVSLSTERTTTRKTNTFEAVIRADGSLRVFAGSTNGSTISGNDGEVVIVKVKIDKNMEPGAYPIVLREVSIADANAVSHDVSFVKSTLVVNDYLPGDANGDGKINVADYTAIVHYYMGNTPASFNEKAADANEDGKINVADYTAVVHMYLYGGTSSARQHSARKTPTDISQADNIIYIEPTEVEPGQEATLSVRMKNSVPIEGFNFDLYLPDGMSFVTDADGFPETFLSTERTTTRKTNTFESTVMPNGSLRVFAGSTNGSAISGNDGEVAQVTIQVSSSMAAGTYPLVLCQIALADTEANSLDTDEVECSITVKGNTPTPDWHDGQFFTSKTIEGVDMTFQVVSAAEKTCQVSRVIEGYDEDGLPEYAEAKAVDEAYTGKITVPGEVEGLKVIRIADDAFINCDFTQVTIQEGVTAIGDYALELCYKLKQIDFPESLESIGEWAFFFCKELRSLAIPKNVSDIRLNEWSGNSDPFCFCSALQSITVDPQNRYYDSRENCNAIIHTATNTLIRGCHSTKFVEGIEVIGAAACGDYGYTSVELPSTVKTIGESAFIDCKDIETLVIPAKVIDIGSDAFEGCLNLRNVYSHIQRPYDIDSHVFYGGYNAEKVIYEQATLYVPKGTKPLYEAANGWNNFGHIVEVDSPAAITNAKMNNGVDALVYSLSGQRLAAPKKGINIVGGRKVVVR